MKQFIYNTVFATYISLSISAVVSAQSRQNYVGDWYTASAQSREPLEVSILEPLKTDKPAPKSIQ